MSNGLQYHATIRINPADGADEVLDLVALFTDAQGPTKEGMDYPADMGERETVNRRLEVARHGFRPRLKWTIQIHTADDEATVKQILNAFAAPRTRVFLSLDNGATDREAYLRRLRGPKPLARKWGVGVEYQIDLELVDPLSDIVASDGAGAW